MQEFNTQTLTLLVDQLNLQGFAVCDQFLPNSVIENLALQLMQGHAQGRMVAAKTGLLNKTQQSTIRGDYIFWLDEKMEANHSETVNAEELGIQTYFQQMFALKQSINQRLFLNLFELETHFSLYPIGGAYQKHLDQFSHGNNAHGSNAQNNHAKARQISSILYLNPAWQTSDGGELRLYIDENQSIDILPTAGKLVLFLSSEFWHEVLPAKRQRLSLTGWFRTRSQAII